MEYISVQKYVLTSPYKLRQVSALVRKMNANDAVERLPFVAKRASLPLRKVIMTAIANAKQKNANVSELYIKEIQINEGPRLKRWRAASRGRVSPYKKRMSHIRVVLAEGSDISDKKIASQKAQKIMNNLGNSVPSKSKESSTFRKTNKKGEKAQK